MKNPVQLQVTENQNKLEERLPPNRLLDGAITIGCMLFLIFSFGLWLYIDSTLGKILYYIFFLIPNYACGEELFSRIFSKKFGLSISKSGFSIVRIIVGVLLTLVLFGIIYGAGFLIMWTVSA